MTDIETQGFSTHTHGDPEMKLAFIFSHPYMEGKSFVQPSFFFTKSLPIQRSTAKPTPCALQRRLDSDSPKQKRGENCYHGKHGVVKNSICSILYQCANDFLSTLLLVLSFVFFSKFAMKSLF